MAIRSKFNPETANPTSRTFAIIKAHKLDNDSRPDRRQSILYHALSITDRLYIEESMMDWRDKL